MLWYDGRIVEGPVPFDLADRGLLLGDGMFDTALALDGRIVFEAAHVARLVAAAETLGFLVDARVIIEAMRAVAGAAPRAAVRTTVTRGAGPRGIAPPAEPRPLVFASAAAANPGFAYASLRLQVSTIARNETSPASRTKTLGYLDAVLAAHAARAEGFDEALFLNTRGRVACAGTGNVFAVIDRQLVTPPVEEGVLAGIVRALLLEQAPSLGLPVQERALSLDELRQAQAVFVTNSLRLLSPVAAIGDRSWPDDEDVTTARCRELIARAVAAAQA
ncbi:aminotransferase class IV [Methylobacterium gnaphalii]|uniref:Probable branched-chain-amino-acid aminotransferase n=1 Tax=Methylobacterium gnaphalii TaxID=1010610 RepID=A0A512JNE6_9HYPH|nr:aminotransferase class IV [Methylobacterium gnaphalii]GEP11474.1 4-amino-4-deoxychorismate lyase [Methylobacterium gnaphalii]GJD70245.1 D-alanine aminotransferase [Methylobacterium gnaphalii]GLS49478.1 4-amino-4-deoxychorismate lyase [Methylobacterium gnaphalii]